MEKTLAHKVAPNTDQAAVETGEAQREKRARTMAALGLVTNRGTHYQVMGPRQGRSRVTYTVWRARDGKPHCTCPEYRDQAATGAVAYCEHILAVKYAVLAQQQDKGADLIGSETVPNENATEVVETVEKGEAVNNASQVESTVTVADEVKTVSTSKKPRKVESVPGEVQPEKEPTVAGGEMGATVVPMAFTHTLRQLRQPIDARLIKTREGWTDRDGQKHMVEYVEWHTVADMLDRITPDWSHSVRNISQIGETVAVTASITINGVTREGIGTGSAESEMGIKKAEHDALKRAAVKFGIARDLYQRESEVIEREGTLSQDAFPRNPLAKSVSELATPKQLGMIRAIARELSINADEECQRILSLNCRIEELSRRAASSFINHLKRMQEEGTEQEPTLRRAS